ncbi:MAG: hypothetical protein CMM49_04750 [Rhodospirillaceae bacterium]|nr:hypothetical protein [Rhodospirillaceae bacterium]
MKTVKKILNRLFNNLSKEEKSILQALKKRPQAPYDFLTRYENILKNAIKWDDLDFNNKTVMELGCGPHLGFGPLAIYLGAKKFIAVDPTANRKIYDSKILLDKYFRLAFKDYKGIFRKQISFGVFFQELKNKTIFYNDTKSIPKDLYSSIDIQLSNSCLEHIQDLENVLIDLKKLMAPNGRYIHAIDFGNHMQTNNPFIEIYNSTPSKFKIKHGSKINLIPPSKMLNLFTKTGFNSPSLVPYYYFEENFELNIDKYWSNYLEESDYFLKVGIIAE